MKTITDKIDAVTCIPIRFRHAEVPAPKSVKIELSPRCNYRCLAGETLVDTIYGRIPIRELAEQFESVPIYTYQDGEVFIADAVNIRKYGENEELVRVHFDDGSYIDCTPDHRFLQFRTLGKESGCEEWATEALALEPGNRVRAYRENETGGGYIAICWGREFRRKRSRLVMDYLLGRKLLNSEQVHHRDRNTQNDTPVNLEYVASAKEHASRHPEVAQRMREQNPARSMTPEWRKKITRAQTGLRRTLEQRLRYRESKLGAKNPNFKGGLSQQRSRIEEINHKVVSVERLGERADVYCLEVPATGWFFANRVLVKNCDFCALRTREKQPTKDMDFPLFMRITREMREAGVEEIGCFYLGESFMAPGLLYQAIRYLKQKLGFPYVFLTSNASLASREAVESCMIAGLDSLKWSVNAADEAQFGKIMGVKASLFRQALHNIKMAKEVRDQGGYRTGLFASSIRYDGAQLEKMEELLNLHVRPYVDEHYFLPLYGMSIQAGVVEKKLGYKPMHGNSGRFDVKTGMPTRDPLPCWAPFTEGHVRADGHLSACCFGSDDKFDVGDLNTQSFMEAWNSKPMQAIRLAQLRTETEGPGALNSTICEVCVGYAENK